jgi:protein-disulfide isomerase
MAKQDKQNKQDNQEVTEIEIDMKTLVTPISIILSALIITIPISLSILSLRGGVGDVKGISTECDESSPYSDGCLNSHAEEIGLNVDQFAQCVENETYFSEVESETEYAQNFGVTGVPAPFIGENMGDKAKVIAMSPGATIEEVREIKEKIESDGIDAAAKFWKEKQLNDLDSYETQLRDYYKQQGQSGDTLENTVKQGLESRKKEINEDAQAKELEYGDGISKGNSDAKVVFVEFSDYECPYCTQFAQTTGATIVSELVDTNEVLYVFKDFPLESIHSSAKKLANAARCAGEQDAYFEMHDALFQIGE